MLIGLLASATVTLPTLPGLPGGAALPPLPVRMTKEAVDALDKANHHAATFMDRDQYLLTSRTADFREGAKAFFEKRPGKFSGD